MKVGDLVTVIFEYPVKGKVGMITEILENNDYNNCSVRFINGNVWLFPFNGIRLATDKEIRSTLRDVIERW